MFNQNIRSIESAGLGKEVYNNSATPDLPKADDDIQINNDFETRSEQEVLDDDTELTNPGNPDKQEESKTVEVRENGSKVITEKTKHGYKKTEYDENGNLTSEEIQNKNKTITTKYKNGLKTYYCKEDDKGYERLHYDKDGNLQYKIVLKNNKDGFVFRFYGQNGIKNSEQVKKGNVTTVTSYDNNKIDSITTTKELENLLEEVKTDKDGNLKEKKYTYTKDGLIIKTEDEIFTGEDSVKTTTEYKNGITKQEIIRNVNNNITNNDNKITKEFKENGKLVYKSISDEKNENGLVFLAYDENGKQIAGEVINRNDNGFVKNQFFSSVNKNIETVKVGDTENTTVSQNGKIIGKGTIKTNSDGSKEETYINENGRKTIRTISANGEITVKRYDVNGKEIKFSDTINGEFDENTYQGGTGDCWFISALNAINSTPKGKEIIKNAITQNEDGSVTITFKGMGKSYTITEEEFNKYESDIDLEDIYSNGDNDLLAFEIAYQHLSVLGLDGGQSRLLVEDLTGLKSKTYGSFLSECSKEEVDEALDDVLNNENTALNFSLSGLDTRHIAKRTNGETFAYVQKFSHAFAVKNVTKDTVTFINPWNSSDEITMTRDEFKKLGIFQVSSCDLSSVI